MNNEINLNQTTILKIKTDDEKTKSLSIDKKDLLEKLAVEIDKIIMEHTMEFLISDEYIFQVEYEDDTEVKFDENYLTAVVKKKDKKRIMLNYKNIYDFFENEFTEILINDQDSYTSIKEFSISKLGYFLEEYLITVGLTEKEFEKNYNTIFKEVIEDKYTYFYNYLKIKTTKKQFEESKYSFGDMFFFNDDYEKVNYLECNYPLLFLLKPEFFKGIQEENEYELKKYSIILETIKATPGRKKVIVNNKIVEEFDIDEEGNIDLPLFDIFEKIHVGLKKKEFNNEDKIKVALLLDKMYMPEDNSFHSFLIYNKNDLILEYKEDEKEFIETTVYGFKTTERDFLKHSAKRLDHYLSEESKKLTNFSNEKIKTIEIENGFIYNIIEKKY